MVRKVLLDIEQDKKLPGRTSRNINNVFGLYPLAKEINTSHKERKLYMYTCNEKEAV